MNAKTPTAEAAPETPVVAPPAGDQVNPAAQTGAVATSAAADAGEGNSLFRKISLDFPFKRGDVEISELTIVVPRESGVLRGLQLADLAQLDVDAVTVILPRITINPTLTRAEAIGLAPCDLLSCGSEIVDFLLVKAKKPVFRDA